VRRCLWCIEQGSQVALLVDPSDESVLVFRPDQSAVALRGDDRIDLDVVLPGFELTAKQLFDSLLV
jgi:Uma2 family endonuclease